MTLLLIQVSPICFIVNLVKKLERSLMPLQIPSAMQILISYADGVGVALCARPEQTVADVLGQALERRTMPANVHARLLFAGRHLPMEASLSACGVRKDASMQIVLPLLGGGGDGGATGAESRSCYLEMYLSKKPEKVDPYESKLARWSQCRLSAEELAPPCVIDRLGNVFNKEAVVRALVSRSLPPELGHIRGLKDLIAIHLEPRDAAGSDKGTACRFQCPITGLEFNGRFKFAALRACGHVLSAKALKEVRTGACLVCHTPFVDSDCIPVNGTEEEVAVLRRSLEAEWAAKAGKPGRKERSSKKGGNELKEAHEGAAAMASAPEGGATPRPGVASGALESGDRAAAGRVHFGTNGVPGGKRKAGGGEGGGAAVAAQIRVGALVSKSVVAVGTAEAQRPRGSDRVQEGKRAKVHVPEGASKSVYSSLFTSSSKGTFQETFMCRSLPLARN